MKEVVAILSHADTEDKIQVLGQCVSSMKSQGRKVILSTHISIPKDLYDKVDFVIYDKENPIIKNHEYPNTPNVVNVWQSYPSYRQDFFIEFNHAFAVHKLILNALSIAKTNNFEKIHFINYDYVIRNSKVIDNASNLLEQFDLVNYNFGSGFMNQISSSIFSTNINSFFDIAVKINTKEQYCDFGKPIYEEFLFEICKELKICEIPINNIKSGNIIASKSVLDEYMINLSDGTVLSVFLSKDSQNNYIFIHNQFQRQVKINNTLLNTTPGVNLFLISEDMLNTGVLIEFTELNVKRNINKNTRSSIANIKDKSIINQKLYVNNKNYLHTKRWDIINFLSNKYGFNDYLEIGVDDGVCIRKIEIENKDGVDPVPSSESGDGNVPEINYKMTSDDFFQNHIYKKYDIIFIDGLHLTEQVDKDIQNSLSCINDGGFVILHDCNPPDFETQEVPRKRQVWTGDVWKSIVKLRHKRSDLDVCVVDTDWGVGIVKKGNQETIKYDLETCLQWSFFESNKKELLNIITVEEFYNKYGE
jgi:hypothetical protein